jgi:hypothetical protein
MLQKARGPSVSLGSWRRGSAGYRPPAWVPASWWLWRQWAEGPPCAWSAPRPAVPTVPAAQATPALVRGDKGMRSLRRQAGGTSVLGTENEAPRRLMDRKQSQMQGAG